MFKKGREKTVSISARGGDLGALDPDAPKNQMGEGEEEKGKRSPGGKMHNNFYSRGKKRKGT